jgi:2-desacetyl-2-hydroxyethyl bacteriochlorophyllide A dehydrogenase
MTIPAKMKAAVVTKPYEMKIMEVDVPSIGANDVLVKVKATGICGTDISIYTGKYSSDKLPLIPGHEFSGVVAAVGEKVKGFAVGDSVTADINMSCGTCFYCRKGQKLMCPEFSQLGIHINGSYAEYVAAPAEQVHKIPDGMPFEHVAFIEPLSCAIHAFKTTDVTIGSSVAIIGAGGLGIMHTQVAKLRGAAPIILISRNKKRNEIAVNMGAVDFVIDPTEVDVVAEVKRLTGDRGADFVVESVGTAETYELAFQMVRPGGSIAAFGITEGDTTIPVNTFDLVLKELSVAGSCAGVGNDWSDAIALLQYGRIVPDPVFSMKIPLEELEETLKELMTDKKLFKVFVCPELTERVLLEK